MAIRPEAKKYFNNALKEIDLANKLDEAFDITFRNTHGGLSFWLGDPKERIKERFGIQQEILIIYSNHQKTDARVLTVIENIVRSPDFKHRVEKVVFLLIHNGSDQDIEMINSSSQDKIIVQIKESELMDINRGNLFIRKKLVDYIGDVDLFGMNSPITSDKYFFGRNELIQNLISKSIVNRENSGLFGLRKTGKTSVLRAIERRLEGRRILVEYIECSNPGIHTARWWQVLENIIERCNDILKRIFEKKSTIRGNYTQSNAGTRFVSDIQSLLDDGELDQIILMMDEVEFITHGLSGALGHHWDKDFIPFWQTIRSIHQESQGKLVFLVAGVNPACIEISHFSSVQNPIFQLVAPNFLEPFSTLQVREMVRSIGKYTGLKFSEDVYTYLYDTYGGHPFLIRIACSEVWKSIGSIDHNTLVDISIGDFEKVIPDIRVRLENPIKDILLSLVWWYPEEYDLLRILASGDTTFVNEYLNNQPNSVFKFAQYGILKKGSDGSFAIAEVREFLNKFGDQYKKELSPFTRGDIPPEILPEMPNLDVIGELFKKRSEIELKLRNLIILYLNVKCGFDPSRVSQIIIRSLQKRSDRPEPKDLFVGRSPQEVIHQLYCVDLKWIINNNWDIFGNLFNNRVRFDMNMDTLNTARRIDAHTKPVSEQEIEEFKNSYTWLLNRLNVVNSI